ncbi:hypothetical protein L596_008335 [Steinernema carpocapsae]|uniref:Protein sleepless n=1 Tax=Steinernema carpocapsae TaxID=34508 RepID=A0A4U5PC55_STECR|nr:hypothetical protein L596_008335 [Steinernema carpocapsae]
MNTVTLAALLACSVTFASALDCYQCDDIKNPECLSHYEKHLKPCENLTFGKFIDKEAIGCRKIVQLIGETTSIVRECAYTGEKYNGKKITGTSAVTIYLYQCSGDKCNSATALSTSLGVAALAVAALFARF